jgi:hypothetical protein
MAGLVNTVMNLFPQTVGNSMTSRRNNVTSPIKLPTAADTTRFVISDVREFRITEIFCLRTSLHVLFVLGRTMSARMTSE